ncbi:MAG: 4Fe-4S dicluster domain-containing protein [Anaerolineaceae bacterium]|nr:4Fe-4S dicluster domain-containing protein [Anaerolineaceae bacterium]
MILVIDPMKCTGCMACTLYCSLAHENMVAPERSRITILADRNREVILPITCLPCSQKPCLEVCPEKGAIRLELNGAVVIQESLCTACGKCARACAINAIRIHRLAGRGKKGKAVALKCDQCGGDAWCVRVCPTGAISQSDARGDGQKGFDQLVIARNDLQRYEGKP